MTKDERLFQLHAKSETPSSVKWETNGKKTFWETPKGLGLKPLLLLMKFEEKVVKPAGASSLSGIVISVLLGGNRGLKSSVPLPWWGGFGREQKKREGKRGQPPFKR